MCFHKVSEWKSGKNPEELQETITTMIILINAIDIIDMIDIVGMSDIISIIIHNL